jgi:23S rRNA pseudouridine2605 synthase
MPAERLQKIIAAAGIASRRKAEQIIRTGLVSVNGQIVTELGSKADPDVDHIRVNGKLLHGPERHVYLLMNKPKGYVTTLHDPEHRPTVMDLLHGVGARVYPVGRLDYASEGLLLLTNDGEFANLLMKAASHIPKTYMVKVAGKPKDDGLSKLRAGLFIGSEDGRRVKTAPATVNLIREANNPWYEVTLIEGKNRQIRRMFEEIGHHVEKIKRVRYGSLELDVHPGRFRKLTTEEVDRLRSMTKPGADPARFIPIFTKPKVTYAKPGVESVKPKFIPNPSPQRPSTFSKGNNLFGKHGAKPAPRLTPRRDLRPAISAKPGSSFVRADSRDAKPSFGRRSGAHPAASTRSNSSFAKTSKPNRPEFSPRPSADRRSKFAKPNAFAKYGKKPAGANFTPRSDFRESTPRKSAGSFSRTDDRTTKPSINPRSSSARPSLPGKPSGSFARTSKPHKPKFSPRPSGERPSGARPFNSRLYTERPSSRGGPHRTDQRRSPGLSS